MKFYGPTPEWDGLVDLFDFAGDDDYLVIQFDDGSECKFFYAFYRLEGDRLVVYTEHCGYHSFHSSTDVIKGVDKTAEYRDPNETWQDRKKRREADSG
jgi:hypothetical protein